MWQDLFDFGTSGWEKVIRSVCVDLFLVLIFRVIGKRTISAMSTMDFVLLFLLSNVVQNAIIGSDNSLLGGLFGAVVVVGTNWLIDRLALASPLARRILEGRGATVVTDGRVDSGELKRIGLTTEQLEILVHLQDGDDISQIRQAEVTADGHVVVRIKSIDQSASRGDIAGLTERLDRIEHLLTQRSSAG